MESIHQQKTKKTAASLGRGHGPLVFFEVNNIILLPNCVQGSFASVLGITLILIFRCLLLSFLMYLLSIVNTNAKSLMLYHLAAMYCFISNSRAHIIGTLVDVACDVTFLPFTFQIQI